MYNILKQDDKRSSEGDNINNKKINNGKGKERSLLEFTPAFEIMVKK